MNCVDVRQELLHQLKGQGLHVPDLRLMFKHWPEDVNPELEGLRFLAPGRIASLTTCAKKRKAAGNIDVGLFTSSWYPGASLECGDIISCLVLWLFIWDDEIDTEMGRLAGDIRAAQLFREETIAYVQHCLRISSDEKKFDIPANEIIAFFKVIGDAVFEAYDLEHREILFREIEFFMEASEVEQQRRLSSELPSAEEYIITRMGTGAVNVCTFLNEYAYGVYLPVTILRDTQMKVIWDQTNILVCVVNDLLSLKKEIAQQSVESIVPLLYNKLGDLDVAVSMVTDIIEKAIRDFDNAAASLVTKFSDDEVLVSDLQTYINACRLNCTGNLNWSLKTGRYGISQDTIADGIVVRLE